MSIEKISGRVAKFANKVDEESELNNGGFSEGTCKVLEGLAIGISRFAKTAEALELLLKGKINEEEFEALLRKGIEEAYDEDHAKRREKIIQNQEEKALEQEV